VKVSSPVFESTPGSLQLQGDPKDGQDVTQTLAYLTYLPVSQTNSAGLQTKQETTPEQRPSVPGMAPSVAVYMCRRIEIMQRPSSS